MEKLRCLLLIVCIASVDSLAAMAAVRLPWLAGLQLYDEGADYKNHLEKDGYYLCEQPVELRTPNGIDTLVPFGQTLHLNGGSVVRCINTISLNNSPAFLVEFNGKNTNSDFDIGW